MWFFSAADFYNNERNSMKTTWIIKSLFFKNFPEHFLDSFVDMYFTYHYNSPI